MHDVSEHFQPISEPISISASDKPFGKWKGARGRTDSFEALGWLNELCIASTMVNSFHTMSIFPYIKVSNFQSEKYLRE